MMRLASPWWLVLIAAALALILLWLLRRRWQRFPFPDVALALGRGGRIPERTVMAGVLVALALALASVCALAAGASGGVSAVAAAKFPVMRRQMASSGSAVVGSSKTDSVIPPSPPIRIPKSTRNSTADKESHSHRVRPHRWVPKTAPPIKR